MASIIPVFILLVVVGIAGYIGYQLYLWSNELADRGRKKMEKKNISFSKAGGVKVGVRTTDESAADKAQKYVGSMSRYLVRGSVLICVASVLVNVWNNASLPNYKSKLGWNSSQAELKAGGTASARPGAARSVSSQQR
ncbi:hypothetical protein Tdes44962_MAKER04824 [Teratosphaeria destructans]|uniref:Uncharacterized protein n=1 Tax=Teratosphaeria destructans TaxID=418781 RepID=A0A9W7SLF5_9PEZI|nr:hypothetical protein Tdes44962_MAKER04824 [Teratosphaeria destructans]